MRDKMSEDWSLKGKRYQFFEDSYECYDWIQNNDDTYYKREDIGILKEKIMIDIWVATCEGEELTYFEIKKIIDERFGYE